jgi:prolipoprotein diacylglyceryl transferase
VFLGPLPIRFYALCIILGILVAVWLTLRRWRERGGVDDDVWDVAGWAIVFGIIGGRLYHVVTDPELYFEKGRNPLNAFKIWDGGLGVWGAIALGAVGAWIGCRRKNMNLTVFSDAAVPGVLLAQGIGRWGNWFNNELYGGPTSLPWKLEIHDIDITSGHALTDANGHAIVLGYFQPTFLYESVWDIVIALLLLYVDRRLRLGRGNVTALYVMGYTAGRGWIEALRHDHANHILGLRLNDWTAIILFLVGLAWFVRHGGFHAERESTPYTGVRAIVLPEVGELPAEQPAGEPPSGATKESEDAGDGAAGDASGEVGADAGSGAPDD